MGFRNFIRKMQEHFTEMVKDAPVLFEVEVDKDALWNLYLDSFPEETNQIFRERREYDCSSCRHFIRSIGNAVVIKNNQVRTIWGFDTGSTTFQPVADALDLFIKSHAVTNKYISKVKRVGTEKNHEEINGTVREFHHLFLDLPDVFVDRSYRSEGDLKGAFRDVRNVFKRSLDEISIESVETVLELIAQNSLYRGEEWKAALNQFLAYKKAYVQVPEEEKENYAWEQSVTAGVSVGKIRNHSMGVLLTDISQEVSLDEAVKRYENIVAPANYKRPKAIFTKKMLEEAQKKITEMGYMDSLPRRFACLDDISVNNILFSNKDAAKRIAGSIFDEMAADLSINTKKFSHVEEIPVEKFISDVLPTARELEVLFENKHIPNMVSLIAPVNADAPSMFKWGNAFGWAYSGNVTDSIMRERVKYAGGKVDGDLRFSIQWNEDGKDSCDLDAHCIESSGEEIYFSHARKPNWSKTKGQLDVDIITPGNNAAVENITWANRESMRDGVYQFFVYQYSGSAKKGFRAEIEFDGKIYAFDYPHGMRAGQKVIVAEVTLNNGEFSIKELIPSTMSSKEVWGLKTNQFVPVSTVMFSPNHWDEQTGNGHKHYFFMLKDCVNPEQPNGFYNEFLKNELLEQKRVFEALGSKLAVQDVEDQLSGVGFASDKRAELVVKVKGVTERMVKVKF